MDIYRIDNDGFRFQELDLEVFDFQDQFPDEISTMELYQFSENNMSLAKYWPSMATGFSQIAGNENLVPDITYWIGATLLLSPRAHRFLGELLSPFGEFLPIYIDDEKYLIFNCLTVAEVINPDAADDDFIFDTNKAKDKVAFKPPRQFSAVVCCTDLLKDAIEAFGLQGIQFELTEGSA